MQACKKILTRKTNIVANELNKLKIGKEIKYNVLERQSSQQEKLEVLSKTAKEVSS